METGVGTVLRSASWDIRPCSKPGRHIPAEELSRRALQPDSRAMFHTWSRHSASWCPQKVWTTTPKTSEGHQLREECSQDKGPNYSGVFLTTIQNSDRHYGGHNAESHQGQPEHTHVCTRDIHVPDSCRLLLSLPCGPQTSGGLGGIQKHMRPAIHLCLTRYQAPALLHGRLDETPLMELS